MRPDALGNNRKFLTKQMQALVVRPHRANEQRQQPSDIIVAAGRRVEDADRLLYQRRAGDEPQPGIAALFDEHADNNDKGSGIERHHQQAFRRPCKPATDLVQRAGKMLA